MKTVLIVNAHPNRESFCHALAESYQAGAKSSNAEVKLINIIDMKFDPILKTANSQSAELEPDILKVQEEISKADHLVFVYPNWWGTYPALLKGFFDRVFTSGFAFQYRSKAPLPEKLLTGKSARVIVTMDTPAWYYSLGYRKPGHNSIKRSILGLCGISPVKITTLTPIRNSTEKQRKQWLKKVEELGEKLR